MFTTPIVLHGLKHEHRNQLLSNKYETQLNVNNTISSPSFCAHSLVGRLNSPNAAAMHVVTQDTSRRPMCWGLVFMMRDCRVCVCGTVRKGKESARPRHKRRVLPLLLLDAADLQALLCLTRKRIHPHAHALLRLVERGRL